MKTENIDGTDSIWTNNVGILTQDECLPIMGSCQVSSILQNLSPEQENSRHMDLIVLPTNDLKLPIIPDDSYIEKSYMILKENGIEKSDSKFKNITQKKHSETNKKKKENFEDMLYFVCNLCPFLCTKDSKITEHLANAHKNKNVPKLPDLKCPACANIFYHRMSLRSHLIHDHCVGNSDLTQIVQAVIYYSNKSQNIKKDVEKTTIKKLIDNDNIENDVDNSNFDLDTGNSLESLPEIQENKIHIIPQSSLIRSDQSKMFGNLIKKQDPVTKYIDKKTSKCLIQSCKVRLNNLEKLNYHIECHNESGFSCKECGEKFLFWKPLTSHLWRLHKIDMDLYSCDKCDYKTFSLAKLNNVHKLIHSEVRGFVCEICKKAFKNSKQLRNHKITHKDKITKTNHVCEVCSKGFSDKRQLKVHMDTVHRKIRPFLCNFCGYKGSSRGSLKMHIRQHTGEKPFSCESCSYTTSDHNSLRRHKLRHTGHKPYKCAYCSYACIQSTTYKTHLKTKHPGMEKDLIFTCSQCQFRSVNKDMFTSHMITVHRSKPQIGSL